MRRRTWLTIGLGLMFLGAVIAVALWWIARPEEDGFWLASARLADTEFLGNGPDADVPGSEDERFAVGVHRLARGTGTIYAWRRFTDEGPHVVDEESYEKLTVWTRHPAGAWQSHLGLDDPRQVRVVYASGGSAWPRHACVGFVRRGTLRLVPAGSGHVVIVQGTLQPVAWGLQMDPCQARPFRQQFWAGPKRFDDLTPWLGLAAPHPYDETYR
jgi:hypothetical protein